LNKDLVEWESGFSDHWDDQGHYTKDTEPAPYVWGLALDLTDAVITAGECLTLDVNSEEDHDLVTGLFLTSLCVYVEQTSVNFDDVFDNTHDFDGWAESMINTAYDAKEREWSMSKIHEVMVDNLPYWFGVK